MKRFFPFLIWFATLPVGAQTLGECQVAAEQNYPLIQRYGIIRQTAGLTIENIGKGWYPQIKASAQVTAQNHVVELPEAMRGMMEAQGVDVRGLSKIQSRVGVDATQLIYDGGRISSQQEVARRQAEVEERQNETDIYQVRQRVNDLYFGLLLVDDKLLQNENTAELLRASEEKLQAMYDHGTAALYDLNAVKTERVRCKQQRTDLLAQRRSLATVLSVLIGKEVGTISRPEKPLATFTTENNRPELRLFDSQIALADAQERQLNAARRPVVSAFASGYYGYPGYDMYHDMLSRNWSLNGTVGVRVSWDLGWLWTDKNDRKKIALQRDLAENNRATFLFNNRIEQIQETDEAEKYRKMLADDEEILQLRTQMRRAAESKLDHGIIAVNDLVKDIANESDARTTLSLHEIQYLKHLYDLKIKK